MRDGWLAKIGLMVPAPNYALQKAFIKLAPEGVIALPQRLSFGPVTRETLQGMRPQLKEAARILNTPQRVDLLVYGCTTGSMVGGIGDDYEICRELEDAFGVKTITTSIAVVEALRALGIHRICLATPYPPDINDMEKSFLESSGFEVAAMKGYFQTPEEAALYIDGLTYDQMHNLTKSILTEDADGIFMSCAGLSITEYMGVAESVFRRPAISSNLAVLWYSLKTLGIPYDGPFVGSLMEK